MRNLLIGNGVNIQFNKIDYIPQQIVLRVLKNCDRTDFPSDIIVDRPYLLKSYLGFLFLEAREIIKGEYDNFVLASSERDSLITFKKLYTDKISTLKITDIGFEDYYLIHDLFCHKNNIQNSERFVIRESMRKAYLHAIFNDGKLNELYKNYPKIFINCLIRFDNIFTTNYDSNIELAIGKKIFHIHGQFDKRSDIYNKSSLRNQLPDAPVKEDEVNEIYFYLYSNALSTYCGEYKEFQLKRYSQANKGIEKMASAYNTDTETKKEVDNWTKDTNAIIAKLGRAIQLKAFNPSLAFSDDYHFDKFKSISGLLEIIGLSPWNDFHIFESINIADLDECVYYFFEENECDIIKNLLPILDKQKKLKFKSVKAFWEECYEK